MDSCLGNRPVFSVANTAVDVGAPSSVFGNSYPEIPAAAIYLLKE